MDDERLFPPVSSPLLTQLALSKSTSPPRDPGPSRGFSLLGARWVSGTCLETSLTVTTAI